MRRAMPPEKYWMRESVKVPQESRRKGLSQRMFSVPGSAGFRCVQEGGEDGFGGPAAGGADRLRSSHVLIPRWDVCGQGDITPP